MTRPARKLSHLDAGGNARMVDVTGKAETSREAVAEATVVMDAATWVLAATGKAAKGDVLGAARLAGIMAAKRTSELIPLCHPIPITKIGVEITLDGDASAAYIVAAVRTTGKTGVEMEALTAVSVAALTIYDMAKAVDRAMRIGDIRLLEKHGGVHGDYIADQ